MRKILCLGDSNTYGFNPENFTRYKNNERWSGILKSTLEEKQGFKIIEFGQNNRTCFSNPAKELNGYLLLKEIIKPDITDIIFALGINDLQLQFKNNEKIFETELNKTISKIKSLNKNIDILILIPNIINENILKSYFSSLFNRESIELSKQLPEIYKKISELNKCSTLNLNNFATTSAIDSLHYDINNHKIIAEHIIEFYSNNSNAFPNL